MSSERNIYHFDIIDYLVFSLLLIISAFTGLYYGCKRKFCKDEGSENLREYLTGNRNFSPFPVSLSLIGGSVSAVTMLGMPSEVYNFGTQYWLLAVAAWITCPIVAYVYLPVFYRLQVNSSYEYLELRFNTIVRTFTSAIFVLSQVLFLPVVMYAPALALNQVTGISIYLIAFISCMVCVFYTLLGGFKAVVWTDTWQVIAMFLSLGVVIIFGTIMIGGPNVVVDLTSKGRRFNFFNFSTSLYERYTVFSVVIGGTLHWLCYTSVNQNTIQRYLSLPTEKQSKISLLLFTIGIAIFEMMCFYAGILVYANYYGCDPRSLGRIKADDQIVPLFVMETIGHLKGIPELFITGICGGGLSSLSVMMNTTSQVLFEDFIKGRMGKNLSERTVTILVKTITLMLGVLSFGLLFIVERTGGLIAITFSLISVTSSTSFGIFTLGMIIPWANTYGAIFGGIAGIIVSGVLAFGNQFVTAAKLVVNHKLPVFVNETCFDKFGVDPNISIPIISYPDESSVFPLFRLSYMWITPIGLLTVLTVGIITSFVTGKTDLRYLNPDLISPVMHWTLPRKDYAKTKQKSSDLEESEEMISTDSTRERRMVSYAL